MEPEEQVFMTCEDCDLPFTDIKPFRQHIKDKKHHKQVKSKERQSQIKTPGCDEEQEKKGSNAEEYSCSICQYTQHNMSKPHAKTIRKENDEGDLIDFKDESDSELQISSNADLREIVKEIVSEPFGECFVCNKKFSGPEVFVQHMRSKSHEKRSKTQLLKKMKSMLSTSEDNCKDDTCKKEAEKKSTDEGQEKLECKVCEKVFSDPIAFAQHLTGRAHAKKECRKKLLEQLMIMELEDNSSSSDEGQEPLELLTCEICNKTLCGPEDAKAHFRSKGHKKVMERKKYLTKKGNGIETSLTTEVITDKSSVSIDPHDETQLSSKTGNAGADVFGVKPSAPPLPAEDGEYQDKNELIEKEKLDEDKNRNLMSTVSAKDSKPLSPDLTNNSHDAETKTATEESSVTSVDVTSNSEDMFPLKESSTATSSSSETVTAKRTKSKNTKVKSDDRKLKTKMV